MGKNKSHFCKRGLSGNRKEPLTIKAIIAEKNLCHDGESVTDALRRIMGKNGNVSTSNIEFLWNKNTDLDIDLKTFLGWDRIAELGKTYKGYLIHDRVDHFKFYEILSSSEGKRNEHVFRGEYVNITRRDDGTLRANFKTIKVGKDCSVDDYAFGAFAELRQALKSLVEE